MTPRIALLTISDRPDLLRDTLASLEAALSPTGPGSAECRVSPFVEHVHVDDQTHALGFAGAIRSGWRRLRASPIAFDYVFHLEDDWQFDRPVPLAGMAAILDARVELAQVALRRGPVNEVEERAGGVVEMWPDEYLDGGAAIVNLNSGARLVHWLEHGLYFTTNPSLYRRSLIDGFEWPSAPGSEAAFTDTLRAEGYRFALWGAREDGPWITHTGTNQRTGKGY